MLRLRAKKESGCKNSRQLEKLKLISFLFSCQENCDSFFLSFQVKIGVNNRSKVVR